MPKTKPLPTTPTSNWRLVSWNVNGIRAAMNKGFRDYIERETPDIICLQETKARSEQADTSWAEPLGYQQIWNCADKAGYSGTAIWTRQPMKKHSFGIGSEDHDREGRVITATWDDFHLVNVYTPNSQRGLTRLDYRATWDADFLAYLQKLNKRKPVIFCGDLNCAHHEIDLANPKANRKNAGFTDQERSGLSMIEAAGFVDSLRHFDSSPDQYTWWTYRNNARERNIGWRLDYFWVAGRFMPRVTSAAIRHDIHGSDHCPVELEIAVPQTA
ncbi:exodeoxyribonuclease III [Aporhodopirellula aestuarii]|uniref:Exodeoxyribonuclease III n=1 Tax=Aporhodopirellula aestuarii TaxID=2950107 RepID=A0ABT0U8H5_9BACT|nr:exodeoxyribonuclease III [Aporhodopirellula aestuarii]MCM2373186.1 exodeoxyribonuclease III [Aporhodopirellula aestuarii]